jgi:hypothetical protein
MNRLCYIIFLCGVLSLAFESNRDLHPLASKVEIKKSDQGYKLYRDGQPYYIKGAGALSHYEKLKEYGGNSVRLWSTESSKQLMDKAQGLGLSVTLGIFMKPERHGFNYSDKKAVQEQFDDIKKQILTYKDHPALLVWGIGNELDLFAKNYQVWDAVNDVVQFIHEVDPNHPVTTNLAGADQIHIKEIIKRCHNLDVLSINAYKDLPNVKHKITHAGWTGPYIIGEWGASGYWESDTVPWGAFLEETSSQKAKIFNERYKTIISDANHCLGSYVFYWGSKQERTHTVLSLFLANGEEMEPVDVLRKCWTGKFPSNRSPSIEPLVIDNFNASKGIYLKPGTDHKASTKAKDPEGDELTYKWEIYLETMEKKQGGDRETNPVLIDGLITEEKGKELSFRAPDREGPFRLFVYAFDGNNHVATANVPFYVKKNGREE